MVRDGAWGGGGVWWLLQCIPGAVVRKQPWRGEEIGKRPSSNPSLVLKPGWSRIISVPIFTLPNTSGSQDAEFSAEVADCPSSMGRGGKLTGLGLPVSLASRHPTPFV